MTKNIEALELAVDLFVLDIQDEMVPNFDACLQRALELQRERSAQQAIIPDGARPRCGVCGSTRHHTVDGRIIRNPPPVEEMPL